MKRIRPDPTGPVALNPDPKRPWQPCLEPRYTTLGSMPKDIVLIIFGFLDFKSVLSFGQTCDAYQKISTTDRLWENLLLQDFPDTPILGEQGKLGLEEYKRQCRFVCNMIRGSFASQFFPTQEQRVYTTALTPDGRFIVSSIIDCTVKISVNPMRNNWVILPQENVDCIGTLLCEGNVCVGMTRTTGMMKAWNTHTYAAIPIPQGGKGFSLKAGGDVYLMKLVQGRLLRATCFERIIEVWNLESNDNRVLSFSFDSRIDYMTFHNKTLFCGKSDGNVELCDITTNDRSVHQSIGVPKQIYVASDTKYFAIVRNKFRESLVIKRINHENNIPIVSSLTPLPYPGVAGQFTGSWSTESGTEQCSLSELSSIFQAFSSTIFQEYGGQSLKLPQLSVLGKLFELSDAPSHNRGKLYCSAGLKLAFNTGPSSDMVMFCADFTASDRDILLEIARLFDDESLIDTATKRLMNMPESVKNGIIKVYKKIDFVSDKNPPALLWRAAILEYLSPGSIIREEQVLRKVIGLLVSEDELERAYGTDSFRKRISPSAQEAIAKIEKEVASRPDYAGAKPEAILTTAIIEYLRNQSLEKANEVIMIEG
jgi:hypothetical protein